MSTTQAAMFGSMEEVMASLEEVQANDLEALSGIDRIGKWRGDTELESNIQLLKQRADVLSNSCTKLAMVITLICVDNDKCLRLQFRLSWRICRTLDSKACLMRF
jgi:hypothetical protein